MHSDTHVNDIEAGRPFEGVFAVVRKQRRFDKNGDAYLVLEVSDKTGVIEGRLWRNVDWFDRNVSVGDQIRAVGRGVRFRDSLQMDIRRVDPLKSSELADNSSFIPEGKRDSDDLAGELDFIIDEIKHPELAQLTASIWQGEHRELLLRAPATAQEHHAFLGGLVEHTLAVTTMCMAACERHPQVNQSLLIAAALLHDVGRAFEVNADVALETDPSGALIGHQLLTYNLLLSAAEKCGFLVEQLEWWPQLVHAIHQHHGPLERCRTREALILASVNALDSRLSQRGKN